MALHWLHLSDIHFHAKDAWRDARPRRELLSFLQKRFEAKKLPRPDLIFCTGDIAFGATKEHPLAEQYAQAREFFTELLSLCKLDKSRLFLVPGNHDIDRSQLDEDAQSALHAMAQDSRNNVGRINQRLEQKPNPFLNAMKRLQAYADFIADFLPHQHDKEGRCIYQSKLEIDGLKIGVAGFNSAWSCAGDEDDRHLWLGAQWQFNRAQTALQDVDMRIGLIHHPLDWLCEAEREEAKVRIASDFDFWLFGHMHNTWVEAQTNHVRIGAGALGAGTEDEFGINFVQLQNGAQQGSAHLFQFRQGWLTHPVAQHAEDGVWGFDVPLRMRELDWFTSVQTNAPKPEQGTENRTTPPPATGPLFGREKLLRECAAKLKERPVLLLYGMRGNGKSALLDALAQQAPLAGKPGLRLMLHADSSPNDIFRAIAWSLGEQSEHPQAPTGDARQISAELQKKYPNPTPFWLHLDRAHLLLQANGAAFKDLSMRHFLSGLQQAYGARLPLVLELRERPDAGLLGSAAYAIEVPGLDREATGAMLAALAPPGAQWEYKGDKLRRIYGWIGAGNGKTAHPLTLSLLVQVARGSGKSPEQVLDTHSSDLQEALEGKLLNDLFHNVLSNNEQILIQTLALYRSEIPHDHADWLEARLDLSGGWDGLHQRMLLSSSPDGHAFYLHGFIAEWLRTLQGYAAGGEAGAGVLAHGLALEKQAMLRERHLAVAECWLKQLGGGKRRTQLNIARALEAFYHLVAANDSERIHGIAVELLSGKLDWALRKIRNLYTHLYQSRAPRKEQMRVLEYWLHLDPDEARAWRFLGECHVKNDGWDSADALHCFKKACEIQKDFPPLWTNLGRALLAQGAAGAQAFLDEIEKLEREYPQGIDQHVLAVKADCLSATGQAEQARQLRRQQINAGSKHATFYNDEARALHAEGKSEAALALLQEARRRDCTDAKTHAIESSILQATGHWQEAQAQRQQRIDAGSTHPADYCDQAKAWLGQGDARAALMVLDLARARGISDDICEAVYANALERSGDIPGAQDLRQGKIAAGSRNPAFYCDQAKTLAKLGQREEALDLLDKAEKMGIGDEVTQKLRRRFGAGA
ncbi:metallophosphoesterase [Massilia sp. W12]|uniref:metallophosphoesterase n=1 Tax=Massilia sp. W12 TaxID=3126507 RepID=UPI0030D526C2